MRDHDRTTGTEEWNDLERLYSTNIICKEYNNVYMYIPKLETYFLKLNSQFPTRPPPEGLPKMVMMMMIVIISILHGPLKQTS